MKPWVIWLILACVVVFGFCGGVGYFVYRVFQGARATDAAADHYADQVFPEITKDWDIAVLKKYRAPEWERSQSEKGTEEFLGIMKGHLGSFVSAEPFSTVDTNVRTNNGEVVTVVHVMANAVFQKGKGVVRMEVVKRG